MTPTQKICIRCQECCRWMTFILDNVTVETLRPIYEARGCRFEPIEGHNATALMVPSTCQQLTKDGCAIYEDRPQYCRDYDGRDDPFMMHECLLPIRVVDGRA